jgi:large conductance mechanosensitive channel
VKGFRDFVLRGNVIDLAVAVVIGAAFTAIVNALVTAVINPAIGAIFDAESLAKAFPVDIPTTSGGVATIYFGAVIAAVLNFAIVAAIVYFVMVLPVNKLRERQAAKKGVVPEEAGPTETQLLAEIRDLLAADKTR